MPKISRADKLAFERTKLANERTFLAYFRTFIVFVSSGFAILKLSILEEIRLLGFVFLFLGPLLFFIGLGRFYYVKWHIDKFYQDDDEEDD